MDISSLLPFLLMSNMTSSGGSPGGGDRGGMGNMSDIMQMMSLMSMLNGTGNPARNDFRSQNASSNGAQGSADNLNTFKSTVKAIAGRNGLFASFLPKPLADQPGNGLHINVSLLRDGKNLFEGDLDPHSEAAYFVAGILAHARELTAFCNPIPNSYARLGANEAPLYVSWSRQNRSQLVRLPSAHGELCRVELRGPDPAANPHLAIGLILAAGLDGIQRKLPLPEAVNRNLFRPSAAAGLESLPRTLREAITVAAQSEFISRELPVALQNKYFEYQTRLCHDFEASSDPEAWDRAHSFPII